MEAPDQLRQRVAWALSQILVTGREGFCRKMPPSLGIVQERAASLTSINSSTSALPRVFWYSDCAWDTVCAVRTWVNYYDILVRGAFGNYLDLLREVTLSPLMGILL